MSARRGRAPHTARRRIVAAVIAVVVTAGVAVAVLVTRDGKPPDRGPFFLDPTTSVVEQVRTWQKDGHRADADVLDSLARQPFARWFTGGTQNTRAEADAFTARASVAEKIPVLVAYDIPFRDCGSFSAGGATGDADYHTFVDQLAAGIGGREALVVVEPDALPQIAAGCVRSDLIAGRYADLQYAVAELKKNPKARVYLDAGNPGWIPDATKMADQLRLAGVAKADGFSLNVSNFQTTAANVGYGEAISRALGGTHFVVDTSRNGNGPYGSASDKTNWCNPPGRAPGVAPTDQTGNPLVDAYLWIKISGESDGACHPGDPPAGTWWPQYALDLARADRSSTSSS